MNARLSSLLWGLLLLTEHVTAAAEELRALAVLESIGDPQARDILMTLAHSQSDAPLTREAKMSLERLNKRKASGDNP